MFTVNHSFIVSVQESLQTTYGNPLVMILLTIFLSIATWTDVRTMKIPDKLNGVFFIVGFIMMFVVGFQWSYLIGAVFAFFTMLIPAMIKMHKMGGDIKCLTVVGLFVGIYIVPFFLLLTCVIFLLYAGICYLCKKKIKNVPFAPFFLLSHLIILTFSLLN